MSVSQNNTGSGGRAAERRKTLALSLVVLLGLGCVFGLSRWMEANRPPSDTALEEERLYLSGTSARRMSLGFNGLIADWYWMRSLQYVGRKLIKQGDRVQLDDLGSLDLKLLYPLLDAATTLDPQFIAAYEYGGIVLPGINDEEAVRLLQKGIEHNPSEWRLYQHLGYIYWQREDYKAASATYAEGAKLAGAPVWMQAMSARMLAAGGSRETAREMYRRIGEQSEDREIKRMAELRLAQLDSFDERDVIRRVLAEYRERQGRCASGWQEVAAALRAARLRLDAAGAPLDPADTPYLLVKDGCDVNLDPRSLVPYK
ncbi:MAG TPA: hypothetical protein VF723_16685 [Pyrinomonadaceae bacterium]|jgi:tetratricopeptide (TPR) repeat protein